ncbi:MAG: hypothetical protein FRX49_05348 [Trebouxia sp. A1-2]|nr:MAG: hypothetical protein FRX49_05348 [Trebouxia sp. A1-2]
MLSSWHILVMQSFPTLFCCIIPKGNVEAGLIPGEDVLIPFGSGLVPSKVRRWQHTSTVSTEPDPPHVTQPHQLPQALQQLPAQLPQQLPVELSGPPCPPTPHCHHPQTDSQGQYRPQTALAGPQQTPQLVEPPQLWWVQPQEQPEGPQLRVPQAEGPRYHPCPPILHLQQVQNGLLGIFPGKGPHPRSSSSWAAQALPLETAPPELVPCLLQRGAPGLRGGSAKTKHCNKQAEAATAVGAGPSPDSLICLFLIFFALIAVDLHQVGASLVQLGG